MTYKKKTPEGSFLPITGGMKGGERIIYIGLFSFGLGLTSLFCVWWLFPSHVPNNFKGFFHIADYLLFLTLTYIVFHQILMEVFAWYIAGYVKTPPSFSAPPEGLRVAYLTAFVPGSEPYSLLEKTLAAMVRVDYPHDTWLLDEGNDPEAIRLCKKYGVNHYSRNGIEEFNTFHGKYKKKTKGGNYNSWLYHCAKEYDVIAQHDMDFIPSRNFLTRTLPYFADPDVAFVGTPQIYGNTDESWIARGAAEQAYSFYGSMQRGFYGHNMTLLIGANHLFRTSAYADTDGYMAHLTEDMLTGMKLYSLDRRWKSVYVPEILLVGEGPSTWPAYFAQQMRWAYGCMDIALRHAPRLLPKMVFRHIVNYFILMQFYFSGLAQVVGVGILAIYFFFGITPASVPVEPFLILFIPLVVYQLIFQLWLQRFNIDPKRESGLFLRGKLLALAVWPVYFMAFIGVIQGKPLTYVVTPKGDQQNTYRMPELFLIHLILGEITLLGLVSGLLTDHEAASMVFWAVLNTLFMFYFVAAETIPHFFSPRRREAQLIESS